MPFRPSHALAVAAAALLSGCGSNSPASPATSGFGDAKPLRPPAQHPSTSKSRGRDRRSAASAIGATRRVDAGGAQLMVTVRRLIDPLRGSGAALLPRTHAVGVLVQIRNMGPAVYDSSATGDLSIVPSAGTAPPLFAPHGICQTQLRDFDNYITAGEVRDGCLVFDVSNGAKVRQVRFSPHAQATGRATWTVTR